MLRVTGRKDQWGEVQDWICNDCRFEKKKVSDWTIEGPSHIDRHSVIAQNHYELQNLKLDVGRQLNKLAGEAEKNNTNTSTKKATAKK